jgi:hypothetical protein
MELTFECPKCGAINHVPWDGSAVVSCRACGEARELHRDVVQDGSLRACPWCATEDLYVQKDFPQGLGLLIVVVGFAVATVFWFFEMPIPTYSVLLASALLDMVLYYRVPNVTICYRCLSQYRGAGSNPGNRFHPFDLAIGERYRQERLRVEQLRERRASPNSPPLS